MLLGYLLRFYIIESGFKWLPKEFIFDLNSSNIFHLSKNFKMGAKSKKISYYTGFVLDLSKYLLVMHQFSFVYYALTRIQLNLSQNEIVFHLFAGESSSVVRMVLPAAAYLDGIPIWKSWYYFQITIFFRGTNFHFQVMQQPSDNQYCIYNDAFTFNEMKVINFHEHALLHFHGRFDGTIFKKFVSLRTQFFLWL